MKSKNRSTILLVLSIVVIVVSCIIIYKSHEEDFKKESSLSYYEEKLSAEDESLQWKQLRCGLWTNNQGDIGFKDYKVNTNKDVITCFITKTPIGDDKPLKTLIDTTTFYYAGGSFYKDKRHIYKYYAMAYGGSFYPINVDYDTFTIIENGCFAKDKSHIYTEQNLTIIDADLTTFRVIKGCLAKDKNHYYLYHEKVTTKEAEEYLADFKKETKYKT
jgi:hypothetical protein